MDMALCWMYHMPQAEIWYISLPTFQDKPMLHLDALSSAYVGLQVNLDQACLQDRSLF